MIEGRPFLYQAIERTVYHVTKKGVKVVQLWPSQETITALIDGNKKDEPKCFLFNPFVQLIVASPLKGAFKKWIKSGSGLIHFQTPS
jgi:hypothetical protein